MEQERAVKFNTLFEVPQYGFTILTDQYANLFWKTEHSQIKPLIELPWKFQMPFYLTFLHDDLLADRFKNYEVVGAIDVFIKSRHFLSQELGLKE